MRRFFLFLLVAVCAAVPKAQEASASILAQMLNYDGQIDFVQDNSEGTLVDTNSDLIPDLIQGIVWIDSVIDSDGNNLNNNVAAQTGGALFAVYSFALTQTGPDTFSATAATGANSVTSLLASANWLATTKTGMGAVNPAFAVIEIDGMTPTNTNWSNANGAGNSLAGGGLQFNGSSSLSSFDVVLTAGLVGNDYHLIEVGTSFGQPDGAFIGKYTVIADIFGDTPYNPVTSTVTGLSGEIVIDNGTITPVGLQAGAGWSFSDDGTYKLAIAPEPASMLVWGGIACVAGVVVRRRLFA